MPRRSSGGRVGALAAVRNPPRPANPAAPAPAPVLRGGNVAGGLGSAVADGMAFGMGNAVAHRAVDAILGPRVIQHETVSASPAAAAASSVPMNGGMHSDACSIQSKAFEECINNNGSDISRCQFYLDMLKECRQGSDTMLNA